MPEDLVALLAAQRIVLATEQAGDVSLDPQHVVRRGCPLELVEAEHQVVLGDQASIGCSRQSRIREDQLAAAPLRGGREAGSSCHYRPRSHQLRPGRGQRSRDGDGDHAVVEHLEPDDAALDRGQAQRFAVDGHAAAGHTGRSAVRSGRGARRRHGQEATTVPTSPSRAASATSQEERRERCTGSDRRHPPRSSCRVATPRSSAASTPRATPRAPGRGLALLAVGVLALAAEFGCALGLFVVIVVDDLDEAGAHRGRASNWLIGGRPRISSIVRSMPRVVYSVLSTAPRFVRG